MKVLFVIFLVWIVIAVLVFLIQMFFNTGEDRDQTTTSWKEMIKQSLLWPWMVLLLIKGGL